MDTQTASDWLTEAPWRQARVTIANRHTDGTLEQAHTLGGKRDILHGATPGDVLLAIWTGSWHTDCRLITESQATTLIEILG